MATRRAPLRDSRRVEFGDWQTPDVLAQEVLGLLGRGGFEPRSVLEPTCGVGAFLAAAALRFPTAKLLGFDVSPGYVEAAGARLPMERSSLQVADFFRVDWGPVLAGLDGPLLIVGNPPWVTNSALGSASGTNLPPKANFKAQSGFEAMTGKSNFDVSEWMLLRLLEAARGREFTLAMLCKASVARRLLEHVARADWRLNGSIRAIDARLHFAAAVDAVLLQLSPTTNAAPFEARWPVFDSLEARAATTSLGVIDGRLCPDVDAHARTRDLEGASAIQWRSGIKHDCSAIMELERRGAGFVNQHQQAVDVEAEYVYPLLKGSDVANGRATPRRFVIVTQSALGEDTRSLATRAPKLWQYLSAHEPRLDARKSSIYRKQPPFAIFGVGDYAFAPFKVAISGLHKKLVFCVVPPFEDRPVMLDDTAYFLPCASLAQAEDLARALSSERANAFFQARVFWDAKRPINKALLQSVCLEELLRQTCSIATRHQNRAASTARPRTIGAPAHATATPEDAASKGAQ